MNKRTLKSALALVLTMTSTISFAGGTVIGSARSNATIQYSESSLDSCDEVQFRNYLELHKNRLERLVSEGEIASEDAKAAMRKYQLIVQIAENNCQILKNKRR